MSKRSEELLSGQETNNDFFELSSPMPETKKTKKEKKPFKMPKPNRTFLVFLLVIVISIGVFVGTGVYFEYRYQQELAEDYNKAAKEGMTYFLAEDTEPEKSKNEVTSLITEAYYTNDGSLAVLLCFANGMDKDQQLQMVEVNLKNGDEKVIGAGSSDDFDLVVPKDGTAELTLYIAPEHVKITNDSLSEIAYDVSTEYYAVD